MYPVVSNNFAVLTHYAEAVILYIKKISKEKHTYDMNLRKKQSSRHPLVIGVSLPNQREARWVRDKEGMEARAKEKGITLKIEYNDFDPAKQASQVEKLISQKIDVLIVAPIDVVNSAIYIEKAHKAGIKVISYEGLAQNTDLELYITFNPKRTGEIQGLYLINQVPQGNYIIMSGDPGTNLKEGAMEYIQPLIDIRSIKVVTDKTITGWDPKIAYKIVRDSLIANKNDVNAILAPNDATAGAAIQALQEQGLAGKVAITGQDAELAAIKRIIQGTQSMTVLKDTRKLGSNAIDAAIKLAQGEPIDVTTEINNGKIEVPSILLEPVLVDKRNIDSVIIGSGFYTDKEVYGRKK